MNKKTWYTIPYWDRVRMSKLNAQPDFDTGCEHLYARQIDQNHYLLSQLVISNGEYVKYEQLYVTIHGYIDRDHFHHKTYKPLVEVWFD